MSAPNSPKPFPFKPTFSNLLVMPFEDDGRVGSLYLPDSAKRTLNQGEVLAVGPTVSEESNGWFDVGDIVVFNQHTESRIQFDRQMYFIVPSDQVLAKCHKSEFANLQK